MTSLTEILELLQIDAKDFWVWVHYDKPLLRCQIVDQVRYYDYAEVAGKFGER